MNAIDSEFFLLPQIHGRSIFKRVIPTVNYLERTFKSLEQNRWSYTDLKSWAQQIIKGYALQDVIYELRAADQGGMDRKHAKSLLNNPGPVLEIVRGLRSKKFESRKEAFEYIQDKRKKGLLPGMGIGYFTKLIYFLQPSLKGYIMDQWLAKSVNLLLGTPLIHIASKTWVSDQNTPAIYKDFCTYIDGLALEIGKSGV